MMIRPPEIRLYEDEAVADLFAGGGGASTGIAAILGRSPDIAINHDAEALAMHRANHPTTLHFKEDVRDVSPRRALRGRRCGFAWFSPDCTYFSKAKGGAPFRDRSRARRIRGLVGVVLKWASQPPRHRPRVIFVENVEEIEFWCPLGDDGRPDPDKRGESFRRWVARLRNLGYQVEWRKLKASDYGAPTSRVRLFIIARCDGRPIRWPLPTHGPRADQPYRAAAECIDFSLPVPSIFFTPEEARAWGKVHGYVPRRPLADATMRRIARGIQRYVLDSPSPFIIPLTHQGADRAYGLDGPMPTITCARRGEFALVTPFLAGVGGRKGQSPETGVNVPFHTITTKADTVLVAPTLIQTSYGERAGQAPRTLDLFEPLGTIVAGGIKHSLVAAFLAKHNAGHEATGQALTAPVDTLTTRDSKALVTSHLLKLYGSSRQGVPIDQPLPTITTSSSHGGGHLAEVRAFLLKYYGTKKDGRPLSLPLDTVTTKARYGLVTVTILGEEYLLVDVGMRMLTPSELFRCQGFPATYEIRQGIDHEGAAVMFNAGVQTRLVGNSVPPHVAAAVIGANLAA